MSRDEENSWAGVFWILCLLIALAIAFFGCGGQDNPATEFYLFEKIVDWQSRERAENPVERRVFPPLDEDTLVQRLELARTYTMYWIRDSPDVGGDYWQTLPEIERTRAGDCEDFCHGMLWTLDNLEVPGGWCAVIRLPWGLHVLAKIDSGDHFWVVDNGAIFQTVVRSDEFSHVLPNITEFIAQYNFDQMAFRVEVR